MFKMWNYINEKLDAESRGAWALCLIAILALCVFAFITQRDSSGDSAHKARQQQTAAK